MKGGASIDSFVPLAHRADGRWLHYVNDPIGTPERLLDASGQIACEMRRTAWGQMEVQQSNSATTPLRFQGQYADDETGLCQHGYRYYDSETTVFISADPLCITGGLHLYRYVRNPFGWIDPYGLAAILWSNGYRTPDGKFAAPSGPGVPGQMAVQKVRQELVQPCASSSCRTFCTAS